MTVQAAPTAKRQTSPISSEISVTQCQFSWIKSIKSYSRGQKKVGQCFFANVSLFTLSMVTIKIFIYYSKPGLLDSILAKFLNKTCPTFFGPRL
jgi:hypothetical protein